MSQLGKLSRAGIQQSKPAAVGALTLSEITSAVLTIQVRNHQPPRLPHWRFKLRVLNWTLLKRQVFGGIISNQRLKKVWMIGAVSKL